MLKKLFVIAVLLSALCLIFTTPAFACYTVVVGKDASASGCAFYGRTVDMSGHCPTTIVAQPAQSGSETWHYVDEFTGFEIDLPCASCSHLFTTAKEDIKDFKGVWAESDINEFKVSISATETITCNDTILELDPYVEKGLSEASISIVVIPYVSSAREGVQRLGSLIDQYGMASSEACVIADENELWYFEAYSGHQWLAQKVPNDCYLVAGNDGLLGCVDLADTENVIFSKNFYNLPSSYNLLKEIDGKFHVAATYCKQLDDYSQLRNWRGKTYFNSSKYVNYDRNLRFDAFEQPEHKISIQECFALFRDRYLETEFSTEENTNYRPIAVDRSNNAHFIEYRKSKAPLMWLAVGGQEFSPFLPMYFNLNSVPKEYALLYKEYDLNSAYWCYRTLFSLTAANRKKYKDLVQCSWIDFETRLVEGLTQMDKRYEAAGSTGAAASEIFAEISHASLKNAGNLIQLISKSQLDESGSYEKHTNYEAENTQFAVIVGYIGIGMIILIAYIYSFIFNI